MDGRDISDQNVAFISFSKRVPTAILNVRNSLLFAFLAISDQNVTIFDVRYSPEVYDKPFYARRLVRSGIPHAKYVEKVFCDLG